MTFPKRLHCLYRFEKEGKRYVADLGRDQVLLLSSCAWEMLPLCENHTEEEIQRQFLDKYSPESLYNAFEELEKLQKKGLIFTNEDEIIQATIYSSSRPRIFIPQEAFYWFPESSHLTQGTKMALHYMIEHLAKFADIHLVGEKFQQLAEGVYEVPLTLSEVFATPWKLEQQNYLGIMALHIGAQGNIIPLYQRVDLPIILQIHALRGHGGEEINSTLMHYAAMRPFDAFTVPSKYVIDFYSQFVLDKDCFFVIPNGVDTELFHPMEKDKAKQEIAEKIGKPCILERPIVGYLSRFQPEKGASLFLKLARLLPDIIFLVGSRTLGRYVDHDLPENIVYAGFLTREELPLLYNAFDVYCFPTISGEETFGLTLLEAMACGIPPVIPDWGGMPEVAGEAGTLVEASFFSEDIGSFAAAISPWELAKAIENLILDEGKRQKLGQKARERALLFSWERTAQRIIQIFEHLRQRQRLFKKNPYWTRFISKVNTFNNGKTNPQAVLLNVTDRGENPLMFGGYPQSLLEGLALSLLRRHTPHEVEAVILELCSDRQEVRSLMNRMNGFLEAATE